ncbi:hypothetical protein EDD22DRAFT_961257 [Suillus occidentalis]|nr:hypothetical protein EDD22DRAFT_961257 [Suillus occidentalis]
MCFFRAKAQAKELAIHKEAHAFECQVRAEHECEILSLRCPHHLCHLTLDNQGTEPHWASLPLHAAPPLHTKPTLSPVAQVIVSAIATAPTSPAPPAPPTPSPAPDTGAEINNLIAKSEQMDIEADACHLGFFTADLFGAMHSINIQSECASS